VQRTEESFHLKKYEAKGQIWRSLDVRQVVARMQHFPACEMRSDLKVRQFAAVLRVAFGVALRETT